MKRNAAMVAMLSLLMMAGVVCAQEEAPQKPVRFAEQVQVMDLDRGTVMVTRPGQEPVQAISYKAYPYGSTFEASDGAKFRLVFSDLTYAVVKGPARLIPRAPTALEVKEDSTSYQKVVLEVQRGDVNLSVETRALAGQFTLVTPLGTFTSLNGMSKLHMGEITGGTVTEEDFSFRTLSGEATYEGHHYKATTTQANAFTSADTTSDSATILTGKSGEVKMDIPMSGDGKVSNFSLTPGATVRITRAKAPGSKNWVVSVLTLYANGEAKNYFCYIENRGEGFYSGEIVDSVLPDEEEEEEEGEGEEGEEGGSDAGSSGADDLEDFGDDLE